MFNRSVRKRSTSLGTKNVFKSDGLLNYYGKFSKDTAFFDDLKKHPALLDLIRYDSQFNNIKKVRFESGLAGIIRLKPGKIKKIVNHVALSVWPDIEEAFLKADKCWISQHLVQVFYEKDNIKNLFLMDTCCEESPALQGSFRESFYRWMLSVMHGNDDKDFYRQLELIGRYAYFFLAPFEHMKKFNALNDNQDYECIPDGIGKTENKLTMQALSRKYRVHWAPSGSAERSRIPARIKSERSCSFGIFPPGTSLDNSFKKFIPEMHPHYQGMGAWRVVHSSLFAKNARYCLDMPLIASHSDSIALLLIPAMTIGKLTDEALRLYNLAAISFLVGDGHHSIIECAWVWKIFGIPSIDGDYHSLFPEEFLRDYPELSELFDELQSATYKLCR